MATSDHVARLGRGVQEWNEWRARYPDEHPDLSGANLYGLPLNQVNLRGTQLAGANLSAANLTNADLSDANLAKAELVGARLDGANLNRAGLDGAQLSGAFLSDALLAEATLRNCDLRSAWLVGARLQHADLSGSDLTGATLTFAWLWNTNLSQTTLVKAKLGNSYLGGARLDDADLTGANLSAAQLLGTSLKRARLIGCNVHATAVWDVDLDGAVQSGLVITPALTETQVTAENLKIAQFLYLLLNNPEIRDIIDTLTTKVVLILGRFTEERKIVLDGIRESLRRRDYVPVMFDFARPASKDVTGTVETLARMARFILADLTDPSSIPHELATIIPHLRSTPVQPLRLKGSGGYSMFDDFKVYPWVLAIHHYESGEKLITELDEVLADAEQKVQELRGRAGSSGAA